MWKGRFLQETAPALQRFSESVSFDWRLYRFDILVSIAHAKALKKAEKSRSEELHQIKTVYTQIEAEKRKKKFPYLTNSEDVHMNMAAPLNERIGPAEKKLHPPQSRNYRLPFFLLFSLRQEP